MSLDAARPGGVRLEGVVQTVPGGRVVLDEVDAELPVGAVAVVHGGNGAGKSVLARAVAGVDRVDGGRVVRPAGAVHLLPERVGALPGCSARTLAAALARRHGARADGWSGRLDETLDALGSSHGSSAPMHRLSKGNLQKAHLAVAAALRPAVVVLDEPMTGLDAPSGSAAAVVVTELAQAGGVVLVTAHGHALVGDDHLVLRDGKLVREAGTRPPGVVDDVAVVDLAPAPAARTAVGPVVDGAADVVEVADPVRGPLLRVRVAGDRLPALLRAALGAGVQVVRVHPTDEAR